MSRIIKELPLQTVNISNKQNVKQFIFDINVVGTLLEFLKSPSEFTGFVHGWYLVELYKFLFLINHIMINCFIYFWQCMFNFILNKKINLFFSNYITFSLYFQMLRRLKINRNRLYQTCHAKILHQYLRKRVSLKK